MAEVLGPEPHGTTLSQAYTQGSFQDKLDRFEELIKEITLQDMEATPEERRQIIAEKLRFDQFCESIRGVFGADIKGTDLKSVFRKISTNPDAKVDWSELFGYFQSEVDEPEVTVGEEVNVFTISARRRAGEAAGDKKRRDIIVSIKYVPFLDSYLTASQKGALTVWTSKFRLQACMDLTNESAWLTGCDFLPTLRRVVACTERSICLWDCRTKGKNQSVFSIKPIEHSPQCLAWVPYPTRHTNEDVFVYGDDQGFINMVTISPKDLTPKNSKDNRYSTEQVLDPCKLTYPIRKRKFHDDWVLKVKWFPDLNCFGSCSTSGTTSFILEELDRINDESEIRGVSIQKGVNAFDYCVRANIIATGGVDKIIRVWHPHIFSRPTGKLVGHLFTIVDIAMNEKDQHIISLSTARVVRIWDIHTLTALQVFTDNDERPGEKRIYALLFSNKHEQMLTGSSVLDVWPLTRSIQDTMQVPHTHDRTISQILYNSEVNQVITICTESVIRVWEADSGKSVYQIQEAHGPNVEVTALCLDKSGYRMATGALDGSIKVWDFGSGQQIKQKIGRGAGDEMAINNLFYCTIGDRRMLVVQGWANKLKILRDSTETNDLPLVRDFCDVHYLSRELTRHTTPGSQLQNTPLPEIGETTSRASAQITNVFKKDHLFSSRTLTCSTLYLPDILATGCADGSVIFWQIHKAVVEKVLSIPGQETLSPTAPISRENSKQNSFRRGLSRGLSQDNSSRVNCLRFLVHKVRRMDPNYLRRVAEARAAKKQTEDEESTEAETSPRRDAKRTTPRGPSQASQQLSARDSAASPTTTNTARGPSVAEVDTMNNETEAASVKEPGSQVGSNLEDQEVAAAAGASSTPPDPDDPDNGAKELADYDEDDPESKLLIDTYDPVLITCHQDSFIRFWSAEGDFIKELSTGTRRQSSAVTALCTDPDCHILVTGDLKGYLTLWDVADFLKDPVPDDTEQIKQVVCWRAHLTKICQLEYLPTAKCILSGSTDGSVRVWWRQKGRYIGYLGQGRPFNIPSTDDTPVYTILPYDISEGPLAPIKTSSAKENETPRKQKFEYPLVFDNQRWRPFRRSAQVAQRSEVAEPTDKKFFEALIKPKPFNKCPDGASTGDMKQGAVFRALPVYRVRTPDEPPKAPTFTRHRDEEEVPFTTTIIVEPQHQKTKQTNKHGTKSTQEKKSRLKATSQGDLSSRSATSSTVTMATVPSRRR